MRNSATPSFTALDSPRSAVPWLFRGFKPEHQAALTWESQAEFWYESSGVILYQISVLLPLIVCSFFIGSFGDAFALSVFGLGNTCFNLAFNGFMIGVAENLGVHSAKLFAQKQFHAVNYLLGKTITTMLFFVALGVFVFNKSNAILYFCGFERSVVEATHQFLLASRYYLPFMAFNAAAVSLLISQGISRPLLAVNALTILAMYLSGHLFIIEWNLKEMGAPYARLVQEIAGSIGYLYLLIFHAERQTFTNFHLRWIAHQYLQYLEEVVSTISNFYSEFLCFEINIYFIGLLHNLTEMALWITLHNSVGAIFYVSVALANSVRTLVGHLLGTRQVARARQKSVHFFLYMVMFAYLYTAFVMVFKYEIGWLFTANPFLSAKMASIYVVYGLNIFPTVTLYSVNTILRLLEYHNLLVFINTGLNVSFTIVLSSFFCFFLDMKAQGINLGFAISKSLTVLFAFYMLYWRLEWRVQEDPVARQTALIEAEELSRASGPHPRH